MNHHRINPSGRQPLQALIERIDGRLQQNGGFGDTQKLNLIRLRLFGRLPEDKVISDDPATPENPETLTANEEPSN